MENADYCFGFAAVVGRPNVGKSTLVNALLGSKVSIVSHRAQTTRHRILGVHTSDCCQIVFVDTPGLHRESRKYLNRVINRTAMSSLEGVDVVLFVVVAGQWTVADAAALEVVKAQTAKVFLVVNKIDRVSDQRQLLPILQELSHQADFAEIIPVSALRRKNLPELLDTITRCMPPGPQGFPADQLTDKGSRFIAAELIREQLFSGLGDELPYATAVEIECLEITSKLVRIHAVIWVERSGQRQIVIGQQGRQIKRLGQRARRALENYFQCHVFVKLWVKVHGGWADDVNSLRVLGYTEE